MGRGIVFLFMCGDFGSGECMVHEVAMMFVCIFAFSRCFIVVFIWKLMFMVVMCIWESTYYSALQGSSGDDAQ